MGGFTFKLGGGMVAKSTKNEEPGLVGYIGLGAILAPFLYFVLALTASAQQVAPAPPPLNKAVQVPLKPKQLTPLQQAVASAILHPAAVPLQTEALMPAPPSPLDHAHWQSPVGIHYGATFDFSRMPYEGTVEEAYQFVEPAQQSTFKVLAYCEENSSPAGKRLGDFCPPQEFSGSEIRLKHNESLAPPSSVARGYLYEDFVVNATPVWILVAEDVRQPEWKFLNYVDNLQDSFQTPGNARMSTLYLPHSTFISLDQAQREDSPDMDIYHFPRQFLYETLNPRTTVITRVNPGIPGFMRWGVRRFVSVGVSGLVWQWLLLALTPLTPIVVFGWIWRRLANRKVA